VGQKGTLIFGMKIHDIKNYQREDGSTFMEKVYKPHMGSTEDASKSDKKCENFMPNLHQTKKGELVGDTNSPI